jgi:DNA-binding NtrC family response regulator
MDDMGRVLIVDDKEPFRTALAARLEGMGFHVESAEQGEEALKILGREDFCVVILDVIMPGMGGMETLRQIKIHHPVTEVILLTGTGSVETALEGMKKGAFDYLVKPCDPDHLLGRIQRAREKREVERLTEG